MPTTLMLTSLLLLAACSKSEEITLTDAMNFSFSSDIDAASIVVPAGEDSLVDWSAVTEDLLGSPIDPTADIGEVSIVAFGDLTQDEVIDGINNETLKQSDLTGFVSYVPQSGETSAMLTDFSVSGTAVNPANDITAGSTYLVSLEGTDGSYLTFTFFDPVDGADPATITVDDDSAVLSYTVDIDAGASIPVTADAEQIILTWSQLTTTSSGNPILLSNIDTLMLARYTQPLSALEDDFLQLEDLADELYIVNVATLGSYDLTTIDGFAGFEGEGTWLVAMRCGGCVNPSPPFLGLFDPQ